MTTLPRRSIKSLYSLALGEGEGVGTAYEYYVKRLLLRPWLEKLPSPRRVLIAGLPEKYGTGLDLLLIAQDIGATEAIVLDDREAALARARQSAEGARALNQLILINIEYLPVGDLTMLNELTGTFDLCLASEVLQRLSPVQRGQYLKQLIRVSSRLALFVPNEDNSKHRTLSGLSGMSIADLRSLIEPEATLDDCDYVDMPPWPPGMTQSDAQRNRMARGRFDALAMSILEQYARLERFFPRQWRKRQSHILYAFIRRPISETAKI